MAEAVGFLTLFPSSEPSPVHAPRVLVASRLAGHVLGMVVGLSLGGWDTAEAVAVPSLVPRSCPHTALVSVAVKRTRDTSAARPAWELRARLGVLRRLRFSGRRA